MEEGGGFMRRIGTRAAYVLVPIGLAFAAAQVQGYKMPKPLALGLIGVLLSVAAVAVLSIVWETVKEVRRRLERRETSTAWIDSDPPGQLDYIPDLTRASKKFVKQMGRLSDDTGRVSKRTERAARVLPFALMCGPRVAQLWGEWSALGYLRSAAFIEGRTDHLRKTVAEFGRAQEANFMRVPAPASDEERAMLTAARAAVVEQIATTASAVESTSAYRDSVREFFDQSVSRALRVASGRLVDQLDAMIAVLHRSLTDSERFLALIDQKAGS
jgi:hypothetical protein